MSKYDNWLLSQADEYWAECEPKVIRTEYEVDCDEYGERITVPQPVLNCHECENKECEYWSEFNEI